jgi:hypothetical protein
MLALPLNSEQREVEAPCARSALRSGSSGVWALRVAFDALEFLERSRDLAAEAVVASPLPLPTQAR